MVVIPAVLSLGERLSQTSMSRNYVASRCIILFGTSVSGHAFLIFHGSSKRFRCEVMFDNDYTFLSKTGLHNVHTCTAFEQLAWAMAQHSDPQQVCRDTPVCQSMTGVPQICIRNCMYILPHLPRWIYECNIKLLHVKYLLAPVSAFHMCVVDYEVHHQAQFLLIGIHSVGSSAN
jgi:hypothetical protein